ncbi:hypothetical protein RAK27_16080 [Carnobacterium maltaromaticum]|uniref:DUF5082 domain-containing protein n=1 Tax=Carnobacterium maltaromaticum TaxID=2751 RepID=A0AAW9K628_CARML|nr:hypothetical protein [Carnobacterium maltaromaticum]MDZ5760156.1 hypothetical protein [Carnobacterium maltaromaticum]
MAKTEQEKAAEDAAKVAEKKKQRDANNKSIKESKAKIKTYDDKIAANNVILEDLRQAVEDVKKLQKEIETEHTNLIDNTEWTVNSDYDFGVHVKDFKGVYISDCKEAFLMNFQNPLGSFGIVMKAITSKTTIVKAIEDKIEEKERIVKGLNTKVENEQVNINLMNFFNGLL